MVNFLEGLKNKKGFNTLEEELDMEEKDCEVIKT